ncbi:hypothetical protein COX27_02170 [Candidatus Kuenenbacteria bacterium CG23_combo_of_CG06-09_8_20_14_all_36_9]|uniref:Methyltransferase type 11 domain-containing protein n=1 Tax=Candidatus Kuenenbacteria bacterium CG10_big_fil_rev_8_21_14_0_10_36_11 TaxID=1974618 RepID=A0A2M6W9Z3_9BACT|nr:MAG: hypothetical protein COX27_02170 [Candidatus Kuenenbacteria bacterium CG23_combo_of_CG06-09_8_20_14_all_36_9]PIT89619.1 MAG: hypothetical protein COU23_02925 [Candidatus Kuenenbacteria bacterium CG10_big_fil_rev_8_21_14_0_10_36_11]
MNNKLRIMKIKLISKKNLEKIIAADPTQRAYSTVNYYKPIIKYLYLQRIKDGLELLGKNKYKNLLDIGFGAGIILPELAKHTEKITGIDIHKNIETVKEIIKDKNLNNVELQQGDVLNLNFSTESFEAIWCLSTLEFILDYSRALQEMKRVAKNNATIIIGFPLTNKITDLAYKIIGFKNKEEHQNSQKELLPAIEKNFKIEKIKYFPRFLPKGLGMYCTLKVIKK